MKINWFSPLPPAKTEIASYTSQILPFLMELAVVTLWTDQTDWDPNIGKTTKVIHYEYSQIDWREVNQADLTFFNIGNNPEFHHSIWQVSQQHPGVVILHDLSLQHFFAALYTEKWQNRKGYVDIMEFYYGESGRLAAENFFIEACTIDHLAQYFPLTQLAIENSVGVVVHTKTGLTELQQFNKSAICYAPLPCTANIPNLENVQKSTTPPYQLIIFGYIGLNRRLIPVLEALSKMPENNKFKLNIYGTLWDTTYVKRKITSLCLDNIVEIHGFVSKAELHTALMSAHLAINLRNPTMGEASASQLIIWAYQLPSLLSNVGWYSEITSNATAFVRTDHEIEDIQKHLRSFIENPTRFKKMGEIGYTILKQQHLPSPYAQTMINYASKVKSLHRHFNAMEMAKKTGKEMSIWIDSSNSEENFNKIAQEIFTLNLD